MYLRRLLPSFVGIACLAIALGACAPETGDEVLPAATDSAPSTVPAATAEPTTLNVFAAASLTEAFKEIGAAFAAEHPGVTPEFNFAGSQQLAAQINDGAPADVFASANTKQMDVVIKSGEVISGTQHAFTRNRLVVIFPEDNPAGVQGLADLAKPDLKVVLAAKAVPAGNYALEILKKASADRDFTPAFSSTVMANVVSFEDDDEGVLGKIAGGEADAGLVYVSDLSNRSAAKVGSVEIPDELNVIASYPIAALAHAKNPDLAKAFIDFVRSPAGQTPLVKHGFLPQPSPEAHD